MVGFLNSLSPQDQQTALALGLLNFGGGVLQGNQPGAGFMGALGNGLSSGGSALVQYPQMIQQQQMAQMRMDLLKSQMGQQKAAQKARSALFGGLDPTTGINWDTARQGTTDPQKMGLLAQAYPDQYGAAVVSSMFPKPGATPTSIQEYEYAKRQGYGGSFEDYKMLSGRQTSQETFGNTPIWGSDAQGNPVLMQPSNRGGVKQVQLPPGITPQRGQTTRVDLGDKIAIMDANGSFIGYAAKGTAPEVKYDEKGNRIISIPGQPGGTPAPAPNAAPMAPTAAPPLVPSAGSSPSPDGAPAGQPSVTPLPPSVKNRRMAENSLAELNSKTDLVTQDIDRALAKVGTFTTGPGAMLSGVPGTGAHDLLNLLNTIKANVGFDQLSAMRAASPTGGALGQISDRENTLLQSVLGAVEQSQTAGQFTENLNRLKQFMAGRKARMQQAYEQDFGGQAPSGGAPAAPMEYDYVPGKGLVPRSR